MVDVVRAKAGAHQLLEQIGLFVAALGRAEAGQRLRAVAVADRAQAAAGHRQRLVPRGLAKHGERVVGVQREVGALGHIHPADQGPRQPLAVMHVVESVAPLDAKAPGVGRAIAPFDADDPFVLHVVGELAADAAIRADRIHLPVRGDGGPASGRRERTGRAGANAFAARDAAARAHRVAEIEHDPRLLAAMGEADHVVDLHFAAGTDAARALDAGVQVDGDRRVRQVRSRGRPRARSETRRPEALSPSAPARNRCAAASADGPRTAVRAPSSASAAHAGCPSITSMPGVGWRQHDAASTRSPLISTTQARQLPSGRKPS